MVWQAWRCVSFRSSCSQVRRYASRGNSASRNTRPLNAWGLRLKRVDEVPVVDHPAAAVDGRSRAARQRQHERSREVAIQPVAVQPHLQAVADQARRRAVEDGAHGEGAAARDARLFLDEVGGAPCGQILQLLALDAERRRVAPIAPHHGFAHERPRRPRRSSKSRCPRSSSACSIASFRYRCEDSTLPFSWLRPRLLRVPTMP